MKKIFFILFILPVFCSAQIYQNMPQYGYTTERFKATSVLQIPSDTVTNKLGIARIGTVIYVGNGTYWTAPSGSASTYTASLPIVVTGTVISADTSTSNTGLSTLYQNSLKQNIITDPVTGTGTLNFVPKWTPDGTTLGNSAASDDGITFGINEVTKFTTSIPVSGTYSTESNDDMVEIKRQVDSSTSANAHSFSDYTIFKKTSNGYANNAYNDVGYMTGTANYEHHASFQNLFNYSSSGTLTTLYGFVDIPRIRSGTVTNRYANYVFDFSSLGGAVTNQYGLYVPTLANATNNWGVYVAGNDSYFGRKVMLPNTTTDATGVIYKGSLSFLHNFDSSGTDGFNTFLGESAGNFTMGKRGGASSLASYNTIVGYQGLNSNTTGWSNSAVGFWALKSNTTGNQNAAYGMQALYANTTGSNNAALGMQALNSNTTGSQNIGVGKLALYSNTTGSNNVANGFSSLFADTSGSGNIGLGYQAGYGITNGSNNILIGYASLAASYNQVTTGSNNIAIGNNVAVPTATASNQLSIGNFLYGTGLNGTGSTVSSAGKIGIGTKTPAYPLDLAIAASGGFAVNVVNGTSTVNLAHSSGFGIFVNTASAQPSFYGLNISSNAGVDFKVYNGGQVYAKTSLGIGIDPPTAVLHLKAGTAAASTAPLKFTTQAAALTTPEQGTMELVGNSLQFTQRVKRRGVAMTQEVILADVVADNTVTETAALITAEHGANYLEVGKSEKITLVGITSQRNNAASYIKMYIKYGGVTIDSVATPGTQAIAANSPFELSIYITVRTVGVTGTIQLNSIFTVDGIAVIPSAPHLITINTTTAQNTTITAKWNEANASNLFTLNQGHILCIEPNR